MVKSGFLWKRGGGQPSTAYRKRYGFYFKTETARQEANATQKTGGWSCASTSSTQTSQTRPRPMSWRISVAKAYVTCLPIFSLLLLMITVMQDAQAAGIVSFANPYHIFPTDIHPAKKRFFFVLAPTDEVRYAPKGGSSRVYYFLAESNEEMQDWLDALQTVIAGPAPCPLKGIFSLSNRRLIFLHCSTFKSIGRHHQARVPVQTRAQ